ncbi:MAG: DMT family transporter [Firmicutes bacterium]|nr:DMT family transporter [Bacillota bacterium]HOB34443.1 DMT family transporter [Bacillota bacterium]HPZ89817.1 DMT family transporter [Bacillota bacterium]HQE01167.1 DMT family transporter [Bacillota bacterium]
MFKLLLPLAVAALSGLAMTFQGAINAALKEKIGVAPMSLTVHLLGLIVSLAVVLFCTGMPRLSEFKSAPPYAYLGGVINVAIIGGVAYAIAKTGATTGISAILFGQLTTAVVLDHFGIFSLEKIPLSWMRIIGVILMLVGMRMAIHK